MWPSKKFVEAAEVTDPTDLSILFWYQKGREGPFTSVNPLSNLFLNEMIQFFLKDRLVNEGNWIWLAKNGCCGRIF